MTPLLARTLVLTLFALATPHQAAAQETPWRHALSLMGDVKYAPDFKHFDYVNPNAPKGGLLRLGVDGTFDSFNHIITRGTAAAGISTIYDTLMTGSMDEVAT